jgi:hypothetical protein
VSWDPLHSVHDHRLLFPMGGVSGETIADAVVDGSSCIAAGRIARRAVDLEKLASVRLDRARAVDVPMPSREVAGESLHLFYKLSDG